MANDLDPHNPYCAGPAITGDDGFYGRQDIVDAVLDTLTTSHQHNAVVLHGQRRIGKTSLLYRLKRDKTLCRDHLPIFIDLQWEEYAPPERILAEIAQNIAAELNLDIACPTEADLTEKPDRFRRVFLREVYRHLDAKRLLFLFDEFDVVVPPDVRTSTETLFGHLLQTLIDEEKERLAFVFVVGQRLDLLSQGYQRLFKEVQANPVQRFSRKETDALLTESGQQAHIHYDAAALDEIWDLTRGHPYFTQLIGSEMFKLLRDQKPRRARLSDVQACLGDAMETGAFALNWYWGGFDSEQQWVLSAVAGRTSRGKSISGAQIKNTLKQNKLIVTDSALEKNYQQFLQGDFLYEVGDAPVRYRFAIEFFRRWIVKNYPIQEVRRRMGEISPRAFDHYEMGLAAFEKGMPAEAVEFYRQALKDAPNYALAHKGLARVLRAQGETQAAIEEYEYTEKLDPGSVRKELIEVRLDRAHRLADDSHDDAALDQARRILEIDNDHPGAQQLLTDIYLRQADRHLESSDLPGAVKRIQELNAILPIYRNEGVGQRVRDVWLGHSRRLTGQGCLDEALGTIQSLSQKDFDLLDETAIADYNEIVLDRLRAFLDGSDLDRALAALKRELKPPFPAAAKDLLLGHSSRLVGEKQWEAAEKALAGLRERFDDRDVRSALVNLYLEWAQAWLKERRYDEAMEIARRGEELE
jgi:tetratricopeptide (TPR) repeat protein/GTPase SAR1 family protein